GPPALAFSPDSKMLVSSDDVTMDTCLWDLAGPKELRRYKGWRRPVFSGDGKTLALADRKGNSALCDVTKLEEPKVLSGSKAYVSASFSHDGRCLAMTDGSFELWAVSSRVRVLPQGHASLIRAVAFSPDG